MRRLAWADSGVDMIVAIGLLVSLTSYASKRRIANMWRFVRGVVRITVRDLRLILRRP